MEFPESPRAAFVLWLHRLPTGHFYLLLTTYSKSGGYRPAFEFNCTSKKNPRFVDS